MAAIEPQNDIVLQTFTDENDAEDANQLMLESAGVLTSFTSEKRVRDEEERKPKMLHFFFVAWVTFLGEMSRGVVVPILWEYVQELNGSIEYFGIVSSGFSFARFFAAPFFGWLSGVRGHKQKITFTVYIFALYPPKWLLLLSRIIIGLGAGTLGQSRGYVSLVTSKKHRTRYMAYLTVSQFAGFAVTPGITSLLALVDFDLFGVDDLEADVHSSGGYLMAIISLITLFPVYFFFVEPPKQISSDEPKIRVDKGRSFSTILKSIKDTTKQAISHPELLIAAVETTTAPRALQAFNWSAQTTSFCLCAFGVAGTLVLIFLPEFSIWFAKYLGEGALLCIGVGALALGLALLISDNLIVFLSGLFFTWAIGSALTQTLINSFLSSVLDPNSQGAVMGWLASLGSIARIIGSLWTGSTLSKGALLALGAPSLLMLLALLGTIALVIKMARAARNNVK